MNGENEQFWSQFKLTSPTPINSSNLICREILTQWSPSPELDGRWSRDFLPFMETIVFITCSVEPLSQFNIVHIFTPHLRNILILSSHPKYPK
jgi:hypothetical protein